jgi:hypothetical protein
MKLFAPLLFLFYALQVSEESLTTETSFTIGLAYQTEFSAETFQVPILGAQCKFTYQPFICLLRQRWLEQRAPISLRAMGI